MSNVTIADVARTLSICAITEKKWLKSIRNDAKATAVSKAFISAANAVVAGNWEAHKEALDRWVSLAELGASHGYTKAESRDSMQRYAQFRELLGIQK